MLLQRKALYNLIQLNLPRIEMGDLHMGDLRPWQTENYREKSDDLLFQQLRSLHIEMDLQTWINYGKSCEAPEEIAEALGQNRSPLEKDHIFLIVFELWRRYFPEKRTLSIFCDELDHQMMAYDLEQPNQVTDSLAYLEQVLDDHIDQGIDPQKAFQLIQMHCASDISSFLFDYILAEIDANNHAYARDLLDGFKLFLPSSPWFDYLEARVGILVDPEEGYDRLERLIQKADAETPLPLLEEILFFLANTGNHTLFYLLAIKTLAQIEREADFKEFLEACYAHYDYLELKQPAFAIARLFHSRSYSPDHTLSPNDQGLSQIRDILDKKIHFAEE